MLFQLLFYIVKLFGVSYANISYVFVFCVIKHIVARNSMTSQNIFFILRLGTSAYWLLLLTHNKSVSHISIEMLIMI